MLHALAVAFLMLLASVIALVSVPEESAAYTTHPSIDIQGNAGFIASNGVTGGTGTASDPYIIEGWDIGADLQIGIAIHYTTAYFEIRYAKLTYSSNTPSGFPGIFLEHVSNGTVHDSIATDFSTGIELEQSNNITISGCYLDHNGYGFSAYLSYDVVVRENHMSSGSYEGLHLAACRRVAVYHNAFVANPSHVGLYNVQIGSITWDLGYPGGGNYWDYFTAPDQFSGPNQDQPGSDGVVDGPFVIDVNNTDRYPLVEPVPSLYVPLPNENGAANEPTNNILLLVGWGVAVAAIVALVVTYVRKPRTRGGPTPQVTSPPIYPPMASAAPATAVDISKQQVLYAITSREGTDQTISKLWAFGPALLLILYFGLAAFVYVNMNQASSNGDSGSFVWVVVSSGMSMAVLAVTVICYSILAFTMMDRLNNHFGREAQLRFSLIRYLAIASSNVGREKANVSTLDSLSAINAEATAADKRRSAAGWLLIVLFVPILLYMVFEAIMVAVVFSDLVTNFNGDFHYLLFPLGAAIPQLVFLYKMNLRDHDERLFKFSSELNEAIKSTGLKGSAFYIRPFGGRPKVAYLILSVLTLGLFAIIWWYLTVSDFNHHLESQRLLENDLAAVMTAQT